MTDLVVLSLEEWDGVWRRNQHLIWRMLQADPELRVLFVAPPADPLHDLRSRRRPRWAAGPDDEVLPCRLWTLRPLKGMPRRLDKHADERIGNQVIRTAGKLGMEAPVLWVNDPGAATIAKRTGWPTLYDITDDWLAADRPRKELERLAEHESWLLGSAKEVVACSAELVKRKQPQRTASRRPISLIPNAVDADAYRVIRPRPLDLPGGRAAVYLGTLHADRLDVELIVATAAALGDTTTIALVGPNLLSDRDTARLRATGVRLLGAKQSDAVVGYLQHADVLIVPHLVNDFTESLDPIKLYEYLAARRSIVSTPVSGFREEPAVRTADGGLAFAQAIVESTARRADRRRLPSWEDRAHEFAALLHTMC